MEAEKEKENEPKEITEKGDLKAKLSYYQLVKKSEFVCLSRSTFCRWIRTDTNLIIAN